jgi:hypothetical protein
MRGNMLLQDMFELIGVMRIHQLTIARFVQIKQTRNPKT